MHRKSEEDIGTWLVVDMGVNQPECKERMEQNPLCKWMHLVGGNPKKRLK